MLTAMKRLLEEEVPRRPLRIQTDRGQEFYNNAVQRYLQSRGIKHFSTGDDVIKAGIVERLNRTIKSKMWKCFHHKHSNRWIEVLPKLMHSYNNTVHSSIKMAPKEA
jgi:transposase InsO family protein